MATISAWVVAGTLAAIGVLHIYWALGGAASVKAGGAVVPDVDGVRGTRFARLDSRVYTPLCFALAAGIVTVAAA